MGGISKALLEEATPIIESLADSKKRTGAFAYYTGEDIGQEVWLICLNALEEYNPEKGKLEHYLRRCVTNRLKNLRRDKYFRPANGFDRAGEVRNRINLVNALPLSGGDIADRGTPLVFANLGSDPVEALAAKELHEQIKKCLPPELVRDFRRLLNGDRMSASRIELVRAKVAEVLESVNAG